MHRAGLVITFLSAVSVPLSNAHGQTSSMDEYVGVEVAPGWLNVAPEARTQDGYFHRYSLGMAATLRILRMGWGRFYWTPVQVGFGLGSDSALVAHLTTEAGVRLPISPRFHVEAGTALGGGFVWVPFGVWCDGHCNEGGMPLIASPVVRIGLSTPRHSVGLFARAMLPLIDSHSADAYGMAFVIGLDIGFGRKPSAAN